MTRHAMPRANPVVRGLLAVTFTRPRVEVSRSALLVSMGWAFRAVVPRATVTEVAAVPWRRMSIGAHGWRGRWLVNTATGPLVRVRVDPATPGRVLGFPVRVRELTLSIDDVDAFLTDLR
ncbi:hypothetical protein [Nocardioides sp. YIM 152315]|uniref:hypothetical protein n=1 Tax=Nocardioides sp. YIM 152315 TaxID=3031760 RepID=UPI0023DBF4BD|nr:hypothetical protein [Nocardioides sp. YIM 152315]MDF1605528.1 hypothetical protein [Nocardioides sp. YIM 152315]